jgi:hypothetical protein
VIAMMVNDFASGMTIILTEFSVQNNESADSYYGHPL